MAPTVYTSSYPTPPIPSVSIFTRILGRSLDGSIQGYPGTHPAFIDAATGTTITRAQLRHLALTFAYGLRNHPALSLKRGDTIMLYSPNSLAYPVILYGSIAAGMRITLANNAYTSGELGYQYEDSKAAVVLTSEEGLPVVLEMFQRRGVPKGEALKRTVVIGESLNWANDSKVTTKNGQTTTFEDLLSLGTWEEEENFDGKLSDEVVYLCYSSGTSGKPKGVETTHKNLVSVLNLASPVYPKTDTSNSKFIGTLPFYHIYGIVILIKFPLLRGAPVVVMPRFDPLQFCTYIQRYKITDAPVAPPIILFLAKHPVVSKFDLSSLQVLYSAAAPLSSTLVIEATQRLMDMRRSKDTPLEILQGFGSTETSPTSHTLPSGQGLAKAGSIGILLPGLKARLVDDDGQDVKPGQPGELWIHGPTVMKGYLNNPTATAACITPDGWFQTGDIVTRDSDGYYFVVDRKKELIKYKGFQVSPAELEGVLVTHPDIVDAAVIGVESVQEATELPRAYVVHANLTKLTDKQAFTRDVAGWIQSRVAKHKYLRGGVVVIDAIPRSPAGKILRRQLRDTAKQALAGGTVASKL